MGETMSYEEAESCAKLFRTHADEIDGVIICLPNFGEEAGVADAMRMSKLDCPILIQACDDDFDKLQLENRRDAFCGKLSLCNNLYQYGIKYTLTSRHTCAILSDEFKADVDFFARVCRVVKALKTARIGQIGARVTPFRTVRYSEKLLQLSGVTVETEDFSEILADANQMTDRARIDAKIAEIRAYGNVAPCGTPEKLARQAKLILAVEDWMAAHRCTASAIQCWDSVEANYGCAMCLGMSMMGEKGRPSACETDVMGRAIDAGASERLRRPADLPGLEQQLQERAGQVHQRPLLQLPRLRVRGEAGDREPGHPGDHAGRGRVLWRAEGPGSTVRR